jgi:uncharacterized protein YecT (DUF1311 family)
MMRAFWAICGAILAACAMPLAAEDESPARCPDATSTPEMNECMAALLEGARQRQATYLEAALARHTDRPELAAKIKASDAAFAAYADAECDAVYEDWKEGTIRGVMFLSCQIALVDARTRTVWQHWLTYMDDTPPVLPEPLPTP